MAKCQPSSIDMPAHRRNANYAQNVFVRRFAWMLLRPLFRYSPRLLYGWRNMLLRMLGAKIGKSVRIYPTADVFFPWNLEVGDDSAIAWDVRLYCLGKITIDSHCLISQGAHLCAGSHDYRQSNLPLLTPPIVIQDGVWCAADCFIGPDVQVGAGAVVGARAAVFKNVEAGTIVGGNPAKVLARRE